MKLRMSYVLHTTRHYIAESGGFLISPMFGSCSTVTHEKIGGLNDDALKKGIFYHAWHKMILRCFNGRSPI